MKVRTYKVNYYDVTENPTGTTYNALIQTLCDHSDSFYFITRAEFKYDEAVLAQFAPHVLHTYKTQKWETTTITGKAATAYVIEANADTCALLQQHASSLYDWVAPKLPEDLTFTKNDFHWFTCCTHEKFAMFSIRSAHYEQIMLNVDGLSVEKRD